VSRLLRRNGGGPRATGALVLSGLLLGADGGRAAGPEPSPTPSLAAQADRSWEGLELRQPGLVLVGRWRIGTLAFREETLRWTDARDPGRNLVLPAGRIASHHRVCRDPKDAASCFEWSFRTLDGESHLFRDGVRGGPGGDRTSDIFTFFTAILPAVPATTLKGSP
jgi:hypothetical protein